MRRGLPVGVILMLLLSVVGADLTTASHGDSFWTTASDVVGIIANLLLIIAVIVVGGKWLRWRTWGWLELRRARNEIPKALRDPVRTTFLLPKRKYALRPPLVGAQGKEQTRSELTLGIGIYDVMIRVEALTDVVIEQLRVAFAETEDVGKRPRLWGLVPSRYWAEATDDYMGRARFVDWNGEIKVADDFMRFPRLVTKGDHALITARIKTVDEWDGSLRVILLLSAGAGELSRSKIIPLKLKASKHKTDCEYLRVRDDPVVSVSVVKRDPAYTVICLGVNNEQRIRAIKPATINVRFPDFVEAIGACNQEGSATKSAGSVMSASEVLEDSVGTRYGNGIKYWNQTNIPIPGRISSVLYLRVDQSAPKPFPVRWTFISESLDDEIEGSWMVYPEGTSEP